MGHPLIDAWCAFDLKVPYVFPGDADLIPVDDVAVHSSYEEYVSSDTFGEPDDPRLHLGLLPVPFVGSLRQARIFILMLNPGLGHMDYFAEYRVPGFRDRLLKDVRQQNGGMDYPFWGLDPEFAWHRGFNYWEGKFQSLAQRLMEVAGIAYQEALRQLSQQIAVLELMPYHSKAFGAHRLLNQLESIRLMREYVHEVLTPRAQRGEILIVVTRQVKFWGLGMHPNIVLYEDVETRSAHLTLNSRGGKAIAQMLGF